MEPAHALGSRMVPGLPQALLGWLPISTPLTTAETRVFALACLARSLPLAFNSGSPYHCFLGLAPWRDTRAELAGPFLSADHFVHAHYRTDAGHDGLLCGY